MNVAVGLVDWWTWNEKVKAPSPQPYSSYFTLPSNPFLFETLPQSTPGRSLEWLRHILRRVRPNTSPSASRATNCFSPVPACTVQAMRIWEQVGLLQDMRPTLFFSETGFRVEFCSLWATNQRRGGLLISSRSSVCSKATWQEDWQPNCVVASSHLFLACVVTFSYGE
jgi:hypothetical protein